ncbi:MAG TPA: hypothetical protein VNJ53_08890 [Gaiellaceae bacterium]|nr:hypothetical protein [Gaiellaceae bacterium]
METWEWIVLAAGGAVLVLLAAAFWRIRRRRASLQEQFGHEYYRSVSDHGRGEAEKRLSEVAREHDELELRELPPVARERYLDEWRQVEARFVSDPGDAARSAERLLERVLEERGYPGNGDVEHRIALVAADHPDVAERFRHGHAMLDRVDGAESTEDLRKAMLDFRAVLESVLAGQRAVV